MDRRLYIAGLLCVALLPWRALAQPTPPVTPQIQEVELPPPVTLPAPVEAMALAARPLLADEAAAIALRNQPAVAAATAGIEAARGRTQQVRSGLGPQVGVSAGVAAAVTDGGAQRPSTFEMGASLEKLLYDYHHTRDLVRQAWALEALAQARLTAVQADLVLRVKQAFYEHLQDVRLVSVAENNVRSQRQHALLAQARLDSGLGLPYDVVRAQTAYSDAIYNLTVAQNQAAQSRVALAEIMGLDPRTPIVPADCIEPDGAPEDVAALVDCAVADRPEMQQAQAAITAARHAVAAARTVTSPVVTGSLGVSRRGDNPLPEAGTITLGVDLRWNAYDSGFTEGRVREAEANLQGALADQEAIRLQVVADVSQAYLNLRTAQQRLVTAGAQVKNAAEALRLAEGRYRAGLGVFIDILDAQAALDTAQTNQVNAQSSVDQARAALAHATGQNLVARLD